MTYLISRANYLNIYTLLFVLYQVSDAVGADNSKAKEKDFKVL